MAARLPPGPRSWARSTYRFVFDPIASMREWTERHGYLFSASILSGPHLFIGEPDLVQAVFSAADPELFDTSTPTTVDVITGPRSMLLLTGEAHRRDPRLVGPAFQRQQVQGYAALIEGAAQRAFAEIAPGETFDALERAYALSLEVIVRVVFGVEAARSQAFCAALEAMMERFAPGFMFVRALQRPLLGLSPYGRYLPASARVDALLAEQIAEARAGACAPSVLTAMIEARDESGAGLSDAEIRDELRTLLITGQETTAVAIAWALYFLGRDPPLAERLRAELATLEGDDLAAAARLPLLAAVIAETLRLRPFAQSGFRRLRKPWRLGGLDLPAGVTLCPAMLIVHMRPDLWPDPERFDPGRFLDQPPPPPGHFFPYGGGLRRCIGATLAGFEVALALATALRCGPFELLDEAVPYGRVRSVLGPLGGVPMRRL